MLRKCVAEFIGTFALIVIGCGAIVTNGVTSDPTHAGAVTLIGIGLAFGLTIMAMIQAVGDTSGCHINPMVTIGLAAARKLPFADVIPYILSQCLGAIAGAALLQWLFPQHADLGSTMPMKDLPIAKVFVIEVVATFMLMFSIMAVVTGSKEKGIIAALTIGLTVTLDIMWCGPLTGASMNPARSLGPAIISANALAMSTLWVYIAAPILGSLIAVALSGFLRNKQA